MPNETASSTRPSRSSVRLSELISLYESIDSPLTQSSVWNHGHRNAEIDVSNFRADNAYIWQLRHAGRDPRITYLMYAYYVRTVDSWGLLEALSEDGLFGCVTFEFRGFPLVSRDLLDSVNEMSFLGQHAQLFERPHAIVDIGAGYGRLAHRISEACPGISSYLCFDAIPESTFLCEWYTNFRCLDSRVRAVSLDRASATLRSMSPTLALNIHSFTEMPFTAIRGWVELLAEAGTEMVLVVPNEYDTFRSRELDGDRVDCIPLMESFGYVLAINEPAIADPDIRRFTGFSSHFMLFRKKV